MDIRTRTLVIIVGGNNIPNLIAAEELLEDNGNLIILVSRATSKHGKVVYEILKKRKRVTIGRYKILEIAINRFDEDSRVRLVLRRCSEGSIGLNITGGTKLMALNAFRAFETQTQGRRAVLSYLNAADNHMIIEVKDPEGKIYSKTIDLSRKVVRLEDLLHLHFLEKPAIRSRKEQVLLNAGEAIRSYFMTGDEYNNFKVSQIYPKKNRQITDQDRIEFGEEFWELKEAIEKDIKKKIPATISVQELAEMCNLNPKELIRWFDGSWLETVVFAILNRNRNELEISELGWNLEVSPRGGTKFEMDVYAVVGMRFFGISCTTDSGERIRGGRGRLKRKLFEILRRAVQIGGSEAKLSLITLSKKPDSLKEEILSATTIREERILVLGIDDLQNIEEKLVNWIKQG